MRHVARRLDRVHDQHFAPRPERAVARLEDPRRRVVVPVVDDMFHDDYVGARRQLFEEVVAFNSDSAHDAGICERRGRASDNMWKIEEHASHRFMAAQDPWPTGDRVRRPRPSASRRL